MSDIMERLREYASDDHERGCQGRYYDCQCGYDGKRDPLMLEAADRIAKLEAALRMWEAAVNVDVTMEGPRYMGVNSTAGRKAWELTLAALGGENER